MALLHRTSYYSIQTENFFDAAERAFYSWMEGRSRNEVIDLSLIGRNGMFGEVGAGHRAREEKFNIGSDHYARYSQMVTGDNGVYSSQLTIAQSGYEAWAQLEVFAPRVDSVFRSPALAREIVEATSSLGVDIWPVHQTPSEKRRRFWERYTPSLQRIRVDEVGAFLDDVIDHDQRRITAVVAGTSHGFGYKQTLEKFESMAKQSVGVATLWVLDPDATDEFNKLVEEEFRVFPSSIRAFQPGMNTQEVSGAHTHRYIPTRDIFGARALPLGVLQNRLYHNARMAALRQPVPEQLIAADQLIRDRTHQRRLSEPSGPRLTLRDRLMPTKPETREPSPAPDAKRPVPKPAQELDQDVLNLPPAKPVETTHVKKPSVASPTVIDDGEEVLSTLRVVAGLLDIENFETLSPTDLVLSIGEIADQEREKARGLTAYAEELERTRSELEREKATEERELDDSLDELSKIEERELDLTQQIAHLQVQLARLNAPSEVYEAPESQAPETMREVLDRLTEPQFSSVEFTGDRKEACELDDRSNAALIARVAWQAVEVLRGYASLPEGQRQNVHTYITSQNVGLPPNKHAGSETRDLQNNSALSQARYLPVPTSVNPAGREYMWAHFKLSQAGGKAPRMHYYDATHVDGKIYIGYIGKHLPSRLTT